MSASFISATTTGTARTLSIKQIEAQILKHTALVGAALCVVVCGATAAPLTWDSYFSKPLLAEKIRIDRQAESIPEGQLETQQEDSEDKEAGIRGAEAGTEYWPAVFGVRLKITDSLLAAFTLLLVLVGGWQGMHLRRTVVSAIIGERARIFPAVPTIVLPPASLYDKPPFDAPNPKSFVSCSFMNIGRTPGIIKEVRGEIIFDGPIPPIPTFTYSAAKPGEQICRPDNETNTIPFETERPLTKSERQSVIDGKVEFAFFGYVRYADIYQTMHEKGFCFKMHMRPSSHVEVIGGSAYNYSRSRPIPKNQQT